MTRREANAWDKVRRGAAILLATTLVYYTAHFPKEGGLYDVQAVLNRTFTKKTENNWLENVENFGTFFFGFSWAWQSFVDFRYARAGWVPRLGKKSTTFIDSSQGSYGRQP